MRAIAGAVIILAGAVLAAVATLVSELVPALSPRFAGAVVVYPGAGGGSLIAVGLGLVVVDLLKGGPGRSA